MPRLIALATLATLALSLTAVAADLPYDEQADARAAVQHTLAEARASGKPALLIFGANWCEDCSALDAAMHRGQVAELMAQRFAVVKVDVGNFDRNTDIAQAYGNPIKKGIPAAVVLSPAGEVLYATRAGELADARRMSDEGIYDFFARAARLSPPAAAR